MPYIPQQRKLGVFSHSKNFGAGRSRQNPDFQRNRFRSKVLKQGSKARFPSKVPKQFQSNSQASFPSKLPKQASQASFPSKVPKGSQKQVSKQGSYQTGSQARSPSKVPKQGSQGAQARFQRFPKQGCQEQVPIDS